MRATPVATNLPDMVRYAEHLAQADMLPKGFAGRPANVLYAMEYGRTLGITPLAALTGIHVIEGKPSASSGLIGALVRQAGHKLRVKGDGRSASAQIIRADDPEWTYECTWDLERAEQAGLCQIRDGKPYARDRNGKPTAWEKYPAAMLKARAITEVARDACEDVLFGLHYTPEELGAYVDQDGNPVDAPVQPLRAVPNENVTAAAEPFTPHPVGQGIADRAKDAKSKAAIKVLWAEAAEIINVGVLAPDTKEPEVLGAYLTRVANSLPEQAAQTQAPSIVDAEVVEDDERTVAVDSLRGAALAAGVAATIEADFAQSYGVPIADATVEQLAEMTSLLRGAA